MSLPNEDESPRMKDEREFQEAMLEALENARIVFGMPPFRLDDKDEAEEHNGPEGKS